MILEIRKHPARIPVIYGKTALMPMTWKRAKQFHESKKGVLKRNEFGMFYLELKQKPSGFNTQDVVVGFDPGSKFDGFSVVSKKCHLLNLEIIHQINESAKKKKLGKNYDKNILRKFVLFKLLNFFPIKLLSVEDDCLASTGKPSTLPTIVNSSFYSSLHKSLNFRACIGQQTCNNRIKLFGYDLKNKDKQELNFFPHCLDSFAIGVKFLGIKPKKLRDCQSEVIFIQRNAESETEEDKKDLFSSFSRNDKRMIRLLNPKSPNDTYRTWKRIG